MTVWIDLLKIRKDIWYSQSKMAKVLWVSRITYNSREKWESYLQHNELELLTKEIALKLDFSERVDKILASHNNISISDMELIFETFYDFWLLNDMWRIMRHNLRKRFVSEK